MELRRAARGYFDERTKDAIKKAFLTSSEPVNVLYDELLAIERLIKENAETLKKKKEEQATNEERVNQILNDSEKSG